MDISNARIRQILQQKAAMGAGFDSDEDDEYIGGVLFEDDYGGVLSGGGTARGRYKGLINQYNAAKPLNAKEKKELAAIKRKLKALGPYKKVNYAKKSGSKSAKVKTTSKSSRPLTKYQKFVKAYIKKNKHLGLPIQKLMSAAGARWSSFSQTPAQWNKRKYVDPITKKHKKLSATGPKKLQGKVKKFNPVWGFGEDDIY